MRLVVSERARRHRLAILVSLGAASLLLYGLAARIPNLRRAIPAFEIIYFVLFALYIVAILLLFFLFVPPVLVRTKKWFPATRARPEGL